MRGADGRGSDVANTSLAALALIRCGSTPARGPHAERLAKAVDYVCAVVKKAESGPSIEPGGSQVQSKLGDNADTYVAALMLAEVKGRTGGGGGGGGGDDRAARVSAALDTLAGKIAEGQTKDGARVDKPSAYRVLTQGLATRAAHRLRRAGVAIDPEVLRRAAGHAVGEFNNSLDGDRAGPCRGRAGIPLYTRAVNLLCLQETVLALRPVSLSDTFKGPAVPAADSDDEAVGLFGGPAARAGGEPDNDCRESPKRGQSDKRKKASRERPEPAAADPDARGPGEFLSARERDLVRTTYEKAMRGIADLHSDDQFLRGFGSNGGEEYLSLMFILESLALSAADDSGRRVHRVSGDWARAGNGYIIDSQNSNGSWTGMHCIFSRTFCTSAAVLALTAETQRNPYLSSDETPAGDEIDVDSPRVGRAGRGARPQGAAR